MATAVSLPLRDAPPGATRRLLELPERGAALSLLEWGDPGSPLALLSHANGFCAAMWAEVAEALQHRFRVVAVDARGQGHSPEPPGGATPDALAWAVMRDDLAAVAAQLLRESAQPRIALGVGHSFGGTLTLSVAAGSPERFGALLAVDPVILPPRLGPAGRGNVLAAGARKRRSRFASRAEARASFAGKPFFAHWTERALDLYVEFGLGPVPPDELQPGEAPGAVQLRCSPEVEACVFESPLEFDVLEEAARIEAPTGVLWAAGGHFPRAVHEELVARMARGWLEDADAGHLVPMEKPSLVLRAAGRVLREAGLD